MVTNRAKAGTRRDDVISVASCTTMMSGGLRRGTGMAAMEQTGIQEGRTLMIDPGGPERTSRFGPDSDDQDGELVPWGRIRSRMAKTRQVLGEGPGYRRSGTACRIGPA